MKLVASTLFLFFIATGAVFGTNYYVSKTGSDNNPGTREAPFLSITMASTKLFAGDTCFIMEGIYREVLSTPRSGTAEAPIVFKAFENDSVVISATEELSGWDLHRENIYRVSASMSLGRQDMLYFNGKAMEWARWPNNTDQDKFTIDASPIQGGSASTVINRDIPDQEWVGGYMWYLGAHSGTSWTREIKGYNPETHTLVFDAVDINKWPFNPHNPTVYRNGNYGRIFLFGTMDALDYPGEWYFNQAKDSLYFVAPEYVNPESHSTEIATRINTMLLNKNYLHVDGIHAFGGRVQVAGNNCVVRNGTFRHCLEILDELDNTDAQMGNGSFNIQSSNNLIENNVIEYGSANGIALLYAWMGSSNNTIRNNVIRHFNTIGIHSGNIRSSCTFTRIIGNSIYGTGRDGVYVSGANSEIAYNDIYDCMKINNDGGVFYTVGNSSSKNSKIHHNWCHDSFGPFYADGRAAGIYLDNDSKGYDVHHNVVWNVTWTAVQMNWDNWYNNIVNNSFWQVGGAMGNWLNGRELIDNKIYNNYSSIGPWIGNEFKANIIDPLSPFNDEANQDFTPEQGSVLIDQGVAFPGIPQQVLGAAPDVGAYEYGLSPWRPGVNMDLGGDTLSNLKIEFTHPVMDQIFTRPAWVEVEALNVNNEEGVSMSLYLDDQFISSDSTAPYQWDPGVHTALSEMLDGVYELTIKATDSYGYAASTSITFRVIAGSVGDAFILGNESAGEGTEDPWTSNMVINKTDTYTNLSDSLMYLKVGDFSFYASALADPITPFLVRVNGEDDFTVLVIGTTRNNEEYVVGENSFFFRDHLDTTLRLAPDETIGIGFLDALPDGSGGGLGAVIPFDEEASADALWYTGGNSAYRSGSVVEGEPPYFVTPPRTYYLRNYHFNIGFGITDTIQSGPTGFLENQAFQATLYPNPLSGDYFHIRLHGTRDPVYITLFDLNGRILWSEKARGELIRLSSSLLMEAGTFLVRIETSETIIFKKLIKH